VSVPSINRKVQILIQSLDMAKFDGNSKTTPQLLDMANAIGSTSRADLNKYDFNEDGKIDLDDLKMLFVAMGW